MPTFLRVILARIHAFLRPSAFDRDFAEELEAHLALAEEEFLRRGMTPKEARRAARIELGGLTQLREAGREARGLPWLDRFGLDLKLSFRMLRKSWGLTLVGGLAMTVAIGIGLVVFWFLDTAFSPTLPLDEGERVVALQTWDAQGHRVRPTTLEDLDRWRDTLQSVEDLGAFRGVQRNLVIDDGEAAPVTVAEITASGFRLARVAPHLGRPLVADDEREGAVPVVVIGWGAWRSRFAADPRVVGRTVRIGGTEHTVVGVMPEGFAFPVSDRFWTPLRFDSAAAPGEGFDGVIFGRLAPGADLERAQAELSALGLVPGTVSPGTVSPDTARARESLEPRIVPYTFAFVGDSEPGEVPWMMRMILLLIVLLLVPPCANIAILVYARTVTRQEELASRFALGASRGRIVTQLFIEVWVLATLAAAVALGLAAVGGAYLRNLLLRHSVDGIPFWVDFSVSLPMVLLAAGLAVIAAAVAGLVPALKATGRTMQSKLGGLGRGTALQLGGTWTLLVILQVALSLAVLPSAIEMGWGTIRKGVLGPGFAADEFLTARLETDRAPAGHYELAALRAELVRELGAEPGVAGVTLALETPDEEPWMMVEVGGGSLAEAGLLGLPRPVRLNRVDPSFFELFDVTLLTGRSFEAADFEGAGRAVIVNQTFARRHFGEGNPLGHRIRYTRNLEGETLDPSELETRYEIVGVVADLPAHADQGTLYHPMAPGQLPTVRLMLLADLAPTALADRLRQVTASVDPSLRLEEVLPLDEVYRENQVGNHLGAFSLALVTVCVLLLSAAGIYALMSFTVSRRRREIGIRTALGAQPRRVLADIFRRALVQVGAGAGVGALVALLLDHYLPIDQVGGWNLPGVIPAAAGLLLLIGLAAAAGPARRGLRVDPIEELRDG